MEINTLEEKRKEIEVLKTAIGFSVGMIRNGHFYTTKNEYHASHAEDIDKLKYPLKLVSFSFKGTYEDCEGRSYNDPNQGLLKTYWK